MRIYFRRKPPARPVDGTEPKARTIRHQQSWWRKSVTQDRMGAWKVPKKCACNIPMQVSFCMGPEISLWNNWRHGERGIAENPVAIMRQYGHRNTSRKHTEGSHPYISLSSSQIQPFQSDEKVKVEKLRNTFQEVSQPEKEVMGATSLGQRLLCVNRWR